MIGMQAISRAEPDGYTLGGYSNNMVIQPHVMKAPPIDVTRDLTPVAIIGDTPIILVVNPARIAATDAKELIAIIKSRADKLNFGSGGLGTLLHLAVEIFLNEAGAKVNHIPYKGTAYLTDLIGGQIDFAAAALSVVLPHIKNGSLRPIGMYTERRVALAPEIPTFVEQGLPNCVVQSWLAVFAPKGMTPALVKKIHDAVTFAYNDPVVRDAMALQGTVVDVSSPEQAQATIRRDFAKYASLVKKLGLEPQ